MPRPLVTFDPDGRPPVLNYNVPASTSYTGRMYVELDFGNEQIFTAAASARPDDPDDGGSETPRTPGTPAEPRKVDPAERDRIAEMLDKVIDIEVPPKILNELLGDPLGPLPGTITEEPQVTPTALRTYVDVVGRDAVVDQVVRGGKFVERRTPLSGEPILAIAQPTTSRRPRLALVETYRLSSFLADYGAGRTVSTFTLLPGEEMTVHVKTYRRSTQTRSRSESILDSYSSSSEQEFASTLQSEETSKESSQDGFAWHAAGQAEATWGWGKAKVSGEVSGTSNANRETFAKTVGSATAKHVSKASANRDVEVNSSSESTSEVGEEHAVERRIRNINLSRTLNFVFRQMNQEFVTLMHLVDVRVAFHNGSADTYREVALPQLNDLLDDVVLDGSGSDQGGRVRQAIVRELSAIVDHKDELCSFVEEFQPRTTDGTAKGAAYLRTRRDLVSTYSGADQSSAIAVPGIILSAQTNVLRTDGLMVEALLGQGEALDEYSRGLQREAVRSQRVRNAHAEAEADRIELGNHVVATAEDKVAAFLAVNPPADVTPVTVPHVHLDSDVHPD